MKHFTIKLLLIFCLLISLPGYLYAKDITVLYSGQTHAMLYMCSCPIEQDGGIARRASLVKELRKKDPQLLLLDCGNFTAGGIMDEYTQNVQLDMQRSEVNFKAMQLMQYDAVGIGSDEFNFGKEFFLKNAKNAKPAYLSANLETDKVSPYLIKDINGIKIGIIGLTNLSASQKAEGLKIGQPAKVQELIKSLKKKGVKIIILLSTLGEQEDLKLISEVKDIDILFVGQNPLKQDALTKVDNTYILRPVWQGRKLGKLTLELKDGKLLNCKVEEQRLSNELVDDNDITAILPRCYSNANCKKEGFVASCNNPGELTAECVFTKPNKVSLRVITIKDCSICNDKHIVSMLKNKFPGLATAYLYYPGKEAQKLIKDFLIKGLPAYILGNEVAKEDNFSGISNDFLSLNNLFMLKPQFSGISYILNRKEKKGSLDLLFSIFEKDSDQLLTIIKEFNPNVHFLAIEKEGGFDAKSGALEVEEYLRGVCVQKYNPEKFWDYLICRAKNINSSYWDDCLAGVDLTKVKSCAKSQEGVKLLKENISLNKELQIMFGPAYLLDNNKVFSSSNVLNKEELKKIIEK